MKALLHQKVDKKPSISRTDTYAYTSKSIDWPLPMSCVTQSCSCNIYSGYCSTILLSVCLPLSDDKFQENNVLTCPASYSYYSTNHNDGVEDYFCQTDNGNFKNTVRLVMHMLRFRSTDPCTKTRRACVDRGSKTTLNFSKHYVKLFCKPPK